MKMPSAMAAMRATGRVNMAILAQYFFADQTLQLWSGTGPLTTLDGLQWQGAGKLVSIGEIDQAVNTEAVGLTTKLAHDSTVLTDSLINEAIKSQANVKGRMFILGQQFFDENWQPVEAWRSLFIGGMDQISIRMTAELREVQLTIEGFFAQRSMPRPLYYSDRDQKNDYPNDRGFEFVSSLREKNVQWPRF